MGVQVEVVRLLFGMYGVAWGVTAIMNHRGLM